MIINQNFLEISWDNRVMRLEYVACDLCESNDYVFLREISGWSVVRCLNCGFIYVNPRPKLEEILDMYQEEWSKTYLELYLNRFNRDVRYFELEYLPRIQRYKRPGRMLDLGCGLGASMVAARRAGWEAYGVEVGEWARAFARVHQLNIFIGTLEAASFPDQYFDVVFCKSILEHLPSPKRTLKEIFRILKDDGMLVCVGIPNWDCFTIKLGIERFAGNAPPEHLYYFQVNTLKKMIDSIGFRYMRIISGGLPNGFFAEFLPIPGIRHRADRWLEQATAIALEGRSIFLRYGYRWGKKMINFILNILKNGAVIDVYARK